MKTHKKQDKKEKVIKCAMTWYRSNVRYSASMYNDPWPDKTASANERALHKACKELDEHVR